MAHYRRSIIIKRTVCFSVLLIVWWNRVTLFPPPEGQDLEPLTAIHSNLVTRYISLNNNASSNLYEVVNKHSHTGTIPRSELDIKELIDPFATGCGDGIAKPRSSTIEILLWPGKTNWHRMEKAQKICHIGGRNVCTFSTDPGTFHNSDVIMVDAFKTKLSPINFIKSRSRHQKLIYHQHEAPYIAWNFGWQRTQHDFTHAFNITSTFAFDSDVPFWTEEEVILQINRTKLRELQSANINYAANKTKMVAWFVSNCNAQSQRDEYVKELRKFISVDIMGRCGNTSMGCGGRMQYANCDSDFLSKHYKFYLSFENNICQDYVTEKLWRIVANKKANVIPIVLGRANYAKLLPPKTYIDVKDFDLPEELSKFLLTINHNDDMYNEYIQRKKAIIQKPVPFMYGSKSATYISRLCRYLHASRGQLSKIGTSGDAQEYWNQDKMCKTLSQFLNRTYTIGQTIY